MSKIRVLQVHGGMENGGTEAVIMNWYREIDHSRFQFEFTNYLGRECFHEAEIRERGDKIHALKSNSELGFFKALQQHIRLFREEGPFDVVHTHNNAGGGLVALAARIAGVPLIVSHSHSTGDLGRGRFARQKWSFLRFLLKTCAHIHLACGTMAGKYLYGESANFQVIHVSLSTERFHPIRIDEAGAAERLARIAERRAHFAPKGQQILLTVAYLEPVKNHAFLIKLMQEVKARELPFVLVLAGAGSLEAEIRQEVERLELRDHVFLVGVQREIEEWYSLADIVLIPSLFEGLSVVTVESQAMGVPCLMADYLPREGDLDLGLLQLLPLEVEAWIQALSGKQRFTDAKQIQEKLIKYGFNSTEIIQSIEQIYEQSRQK